MLVVVIDSIKQRAPRDIAPAVDKAFSVEVLDELGRLRQVLEHLGARFRYPLLFSFG